MKILATADMHIGKYPTHVPNEVRKKYSSAQMWERFVSCAVEEQVDIVLLSGDSIEASNKFFEATGPLERGLKRLIEQGITTYAIAGNHDYDVLPRICNALDSELIHLLGADGKWEIVIHKGKLQIAGYSFTSRYMEKSPLPSFPKDVLDPAIPAIGLLHGDLDNTKSRYCPATKSEYASTGVPLWVVGHIHKPGLHEAGNGTQILYVGSPQGMDPGMGESGKHGPWIIDMNRGSTALHQVPLPPLMYESIDVNITEMKDSSTLQSLLYKKIQEYVSLHTNDLSNLRCLSLRLKLTGRSSLNTKTLSEGLKELKEEGMHVHDIRVVVNKTMIETIPEIDLHQLAQGDQIPSQLAKLILSLQSGDIPDEYQELLQGMTAATNQICQETPFQNYPVASLSDDDIPRILRYQSTKLLETLIMQGELHD